MSERTAEQKWDKVSTVLVRATGGFSMKIRTVGVLSIVGLAMSATPLWAGPVGVQRSPSITEQQAGEVAYLQAIKDQQARETMANPATVKGPLLARYMDKQAQLQDLINRIQSGQQVSPYEIDQALQPANP